MATAQIPAVTPVGGGRAHPRRLISALAISQTVGYGVLYYAFTVLITPIAADLRTSTAVVTGALTVSILVSAAAAIPIGRWLDRHGGRGLMTWGSALGVASVVAWSQVRQPWQLYLVFILIGLASAASLYEAAFPVVIAATESGRRDQALLAVTIVAGFASSIFLPLTGLLLTRLGWRTTLLVLALVLAVFTVPLHRYAVPRRSIPTGRGPNSADRRVAVALRDRAFWLLATAFVAQAAAVSAVGVLLVTYLRQAGHPATIAATLSGLLGVLSVTGRLLTTGVARRHGMTTVTAVIFAIQAIGVAALPYAGRSTGGAIACVTAFGLGFGVATIARPGIIAARYSTHRYATIAATMTLPITLAKAFAPLAAASLPPRTFLMSAAVSCLASAGLLWSTSASAPTDAATIGP